MTTEEKEALAARKKRRFRQGTILGVGGLVAGGLTFGPAAVAGVAEADTNAVLGVVVAVSGLLFLFRRQGWTFWLIGTLVGYTMGLFDAVQLVGFTEEVDDAYAVALITVLVFTTLGFLAGMVAEFIRFLHTLSHDIRRDKAGDDNDHGKWSATTTT